MGGAWMTCADATKVYLAMLRLDMAIHPHPKRTNGPIGQLSLPSITWLGYIISRSLPNLAGAI